MKLLYTVIFFLVVSSNKPLSCAEKGAHYFRFYEIEQLKLKNKCDSIRQKIQSSKDKTKEQLIKQALALGSISPHIMFEIYVNTETFLLPNLSIENRNVLLDITRKTCDDLDEKKELISTYIEDISCPLLQIYICNMLCFYCDFTSVPPKIEFDQIIIDLNSNLSRYFRETPFFLQHHMMSQYLSIITIDLISNLSHLPKTSGKEASVLSWKETFCQLEALEDEDLNSFALVLRGVLGVLDVKR